MGLCSSCALKELDEVDEIDVGEVKKKGGKKKASAKQLDENLEERLHTSTEFPNVGTDAFTPPREASTPATQNFDPSAPEQASAAEASEPAGKAAASFDPSAPQEPPEVDMTWAEPWTDFQAADAESATMDADKAADEAAHAGDGEKAPEVKAPHLWPRLASIETWISALEADEASGKFQPELPVVVSEPGTPSSDAPAAPEAERQWCQLPSVGTWMAPLRLPLAPVAQPSQLLKEVKSAEHMPCGSECSTAESGALALDADLFSNFVGRSSEDLVSFAAKASDDDACDMPMMAFPPSPLDMPEMRHEAPVALPFVGSLPPSPANQSQASEPTSECKGECEGGNKVLTGETSGSTAADSAAWAELPFVGSLPSTPTGEAQPAAQPAAHEVLQVQALRQDELQALREASIHDAELDDLDLWPEVPFVGSGPATPTGDAEDPFADCHESPRGPHDLHPEMEEPTLPMAAARPTQASTSDGPNTAAWFLQPSVGSWYVRRHRPTLARLQAPALASKELNSPQAEGTAPGNLDILSLDDLLPDLGAPTAACAKPAGQNVSEADPWLAFDPFLQEGSSTRTCW